MQIAYTQILEMVSKESFKEDHENILPLVIERDRGIQPEDVTRLTGLDTIFVLTILKELERVSVVRSEIIDLQTEKWYTLTEEA